MITIRKISKTVMLTVLFCLIGVVTTLVVSLTGFKSLALYEKQIPLIKLADHLKLQSSRSHLWLEELLDGDQTINFEQQVLAPMNASIQILQDAYDGRLSSLGEFDRPNETTKIVLKETLVQAEKLTESTKKLWDEFKTAERDSLGKIQSVVLQQHEQEFDIRFFDFQNKLEALSIHLKAQAETRTTANEQLVWLCIFGVLVMFTLASIGFYKIQRRASKLLLDSEQKLEREYKRVTKLSGFIESVSAGNYDIELNSEDEHDTLTGTLITMRDKLKSNSEDDRKRNWSTTGLAQIGEILRSDATSSSELYDKIVRFIVKYTRSNQGGLFVLNDENEKAEKYLDLLSCYAFERKKYLQKQVQIGDGLVGQCFLEAEKIYVTEVPKEYISITSGLGGSTPSSLLVVPMKVNDQIYGVLELASFNKFQDYEIELIEKFAESVAATISNVRVNDKTKILLATTRQQSEEMKAQEEEIRQNMEELEATQEEMRRKQVALEAKLEQSQRDAEALQEKERVLTESQQTLQAIVDNIPRAVFWKNKDLQFIGCNISFAQVAGVQNPVDIIGKTDFDMVWHSQAEAYRRDDAEVMRTRTAKLDIEEVNVGQNGEESWVKTSKVPVIDKEGEVIAILGMFEDITALKQREADIAQKLREREEALQELTALRDLIGARK